MITLNNFHLNTEAVFKGCKAPKREPDYISVSKYDGSISSKYWYGKNKKGLYVIRSSDHWVNQTQFDTNELKRDCSSIASCQWHLKDKSVFKYRAINFSGKCYLKNFKKIK